MKRGATDYVLKDRLGRLIPVIERALGEAAAAAKQRLAEEQIREQAALLDQAQDAICTQDLDQIIRYWNRSAERIYGWNAGEVLGRNANELLCQSGKAVPVAHFKCLLKEGFWHGELHQLTKRGRPVIVESRWTLLRDSSGQPKSILIISTDISEKRRIENQLLRTEQVENIEALTSGITHDLKDSLTPIFDRSGFYA